MDNSLLLGLLAKGGGGGSPEGSAIKSTGEAAGKVLMTDGADGAVWTPDMTEAEIDYIVADKYPITVTLTNATADASNPTDILQNETATLNFMFDGVEYIAPISVAVIGATGTWTRTSDTQGTLVLSNPTGNVSLTVEGLQTTSVKISGYAIDPEKPHLFLKCSINPYAPMFYKGQTYNDSTQGLWVNINPSGETRIPVVFSITGPVNTATPICVILKSANERTDGVEAVSETGFERVTFGDIKLAFREKNTLLKNGEAINQAYINVGNINYQGTGTLTGIRFELEASNT